MDIPLTNLLESAPSLLLMGMRGVGKTTLGKLAAEHLKATFIDADELFIERHGLSPKDFVAKSGWDSFRENETIILKELLDRIQNRQGTPLVISLGGGVVERECNRELLKQAWMHTEKKSDVPTLDNKKNVAVVHVFRELDQVLLDRRGMPNWAGNSTAAGQEVWQRRRPWFRESSSHEFVNFTDRNVLEYALSGEVTSLAESSRAARLRFEAVERDFLRFLVQLLKSFQPDRKPWVPSSSSRSYLVTFPFEDLHPIVEKLYPMTMGADAIELRADLLSEPNTRFDQVQNIEAYENPSLSYLSEQVALTRRHFSDFPLVFTLRTPAQGGKYPYPANAPSSALFTSLRHALKLGCDVIDIEMGLDPDQTAELIRDAKERNVSVLISWRDTSPASKGGFDWAAERAEELYDDAVKMGSDLVKLVGTAGRISDNFTLRVFATKIEDKMKEDKVVPLSAYNMGSLGRMSRFLNSVLASVTHPIAKELSNKGVVGNPSMTFQEIQRALHLSGLIEKAHFLMKGESNQGEQTERYRCWFEQMGLPYSMRVDSQSFDQLLQTPEPIVGGLNGFCFPLGIDIESIELKKVQHIELDEDVKASKMFDCVVPNGNGTTGWTAQNKIVTALIDLIVQSVSPSTHLNRESTVFIFSKNERVDPFLSSAQQAARRLGLKNCYDFSNESFMIQHPTVVINCDPKNCDFNEKYYGGSIGGVYIDLYKDVNTQNSLQTEQFRQAGWHCISSKTFWRHVDALRFRALTGHRAPSVSCDLIKLS